MGLRNALCLILIQSFIYDFKVIVILYISEEYIRKAAAESRAKVSFRYIRV